MKIGDEVCLKSGGPRMTVAEVRPDGMLRCLWFSTDHHLQNAWLAPDLLARPREKPDESSHDLQGLR